MQIREVEAYLEMIQEAKDAGDPERAHAAEDGMHRDVLRAIAEGTKLARSHMVVLARMALTSDEIDFERWAA